MPRETLLNSWKSVLWPKSPSTVLPLSLPESAVGGHLYPKVACHEPGQ